MMTLSLKASESVLIRGAPIGRGVFPEALYIRNEKGEQCSATVVGKSTLLTAAHCVDESKVIHVIAHDWMRFYASCEPHELWEGYDFDIALCKTEHYLPVHPASIRLVYPRRGQKVLLSGFGCTNSDRTGGNDGVFSVGTTIITETPSLDSFVHTFKDAAVCAGDSGGAAYWHMDDPTAEEHYILGVNSRGDMKERSLLTAVFTLPIIRWMKDWSKRHHTRICGVNRTCEKLRRPGTPAVF